MFAVVGCGRCDAFWVVEGRPETTSCPRCETRHSFGKLTKFAETETAEAAREARSRLLQDRGDVNADLDSFSGMGERAMDAGMDDEAFLDASGIDADEVAAAADRAESSGGSLSNREVVLDGLRELEEPTTADLKAYAADHGVDDSYVERALRKLRERGAVSETDGVYRRL
jgi:hypothetical protein